MTVWYKQGVIGDLQQVARKGLGRVARLYKYYNEDLFVTSLRDGNHLAGSLHYDGLAFDVKGSSAATFVNMREYLGPDWDIVFEKDHIHCEFDPK